MVLRKEPPKSSCSAPPISSHRVWLVGPVLLRAEVPERLMRTTFVLPAALERSGIAVRCRVLLAAAHQSSSICPVSMLWTGMPLMAAIRSFPVK